MTHINHDPKVKPQVVSLSGGRTSGYLAYVMKYMFEQHGWNVHYVFMDVGAEHPATYAFIKKMVKEWGLNFTAIRAEINPELGKGVRYREITMEEMQCDLKPWQDMVAKYGVPTINTPFCTSRLKTEPHKAWCDDKFGKGNYTAWLGIRADEPARLKFYSPNLDLFSEDIPEERDIRYLAELDTAGKPQINAWWEKQGFDLGIPDYLGNCVMCIKKAVNKLYAAAKDSPTIATEFRKMIHSENVRTKEKDKYERGVIYRGKVSIDHVIKMSKVLDENLLIDTIKMHDEFDKEDPTLCSESCEIMPHQPIQKDMLDKVA